ncbi:MAG: hypothetical protein GXO80_10245 [Chlorobi bacterium]|nr:hypothetical protein [Chlorobiota bacterium]
MKLLNSISPVNKVYETSGSKPVKIQCDDLNFYVCKYNTAHGSKANKLFREYIGACFIKEWDLSVPDFSFVKIPEEHISNIDGLQPFYFKNICFGSKFDANYKEVDKFLSFIQSKDKKKFVNKFDYLKIALFDIWTSNEDRNYNNFNLMTDVENDYNFIPIDHEMIFNTGNLDKGLYLISIEESIIGTPLTKKLFSSKELFGNSKLNDMEENYYLCINNCKEKLNVILQNTPDDWLIDINSEKELLLKELFNSKWLKDVFNEFKAFIHFQYK